MEWELDLQKNEDCTLDSGWLLVNFISFCEMHHLKQNQKPRYCERLFDLLGAQFSLSHLGASLISSVLTVFQQ